MKRHRWNDEKSVTIQQNPNRGGVDFEDCVIALEENRLLDIIDNENYPHQRMYILNIGNYAYVVPFVESESEIFLKTIFPSRKMTKKYLGLKDG